MKVVSTLPDPSGPHYWHTLRLWFPLALVCRSSSWNSQSTPVKTKTIYSEGIGPILIVRSRKAKRMNISVRPFRGIRVAVPPGESFRQAEQLVRLKRNWIKKHLARMGEVETRMREAAETMASIDKEQAKKILIRRVFELAEQHNFAFNRVAIRNQKTRWGSCSSRNNISLNIQLIRLPRVLSDYVILHELVHTKIKNHSPAFWDELDKYVGDARGLNSKLSEYSLARC